MKTEIILYRNYPGIPLGCTPNFLHNGIRNEFDSDSFESIANFYGYTINYSQDINKCDIILFNLDRNYIYSNLNPVLFVKKETWKTAKDNKIPIVFWHTGECHSVITEPWFTFAEMYVKQKIWYVDSNARLASDYHLFFDSSNLLNRPAYFENSFFPNNTTPKYKFFACTDRSDYHKHIVINHLKTVHLQHSWTKYSNPDLNQIVPLNIYQEYFPDFVVNQIQADHMWISDRQLITKQLESCVIITLNTYFVKSLNRNNHYDPLYITEKVSQELSTNRPVIPVGHYGIVDYYKILGFRFPEWIDYSYDQEKNENQRMKMILNEIDRLSEIDNLEKLSTQFREATDNRIVFCRMNFKKDFLNCLKTILGINSFVITKDF